jgi:glutamate dehydrogenase
MDAVWNQIEALQSTITAQYQSEIMVVYLRLLRRISRWLLRSQRMRLNIGQSVERYAAGVKELKKMLPASLGVGYRTLYDLNTKKYIEIGIPEKFAQELATTGGLFVAMDIIEISQKLKIKVVTAAKAYFGVGEFLQLGWIRTQIIAHATENHWEALSREALRDDLDWQQRQLTANIICDLKKDGDLLECLTHWSESNAGLIERWQHVLTNLQSSSALNYTMFFVAIRELLDLTQTTIQMSENRDVLV